MGLSGFGRQEPSTKNISVAGSVCPMTGFLGITVVGKLLNQGQRLFLRYPLHSTNTGNW